MLGLLILQCAPLFWTFRTSFRSESGLFIDAPERSSSLSLSNFIVLFTKTDYLRWLGNSFTLAISSALLATICAVLITFFLIFSQGSWQRLRDLVMISYLLPAMFVVFPLQNLLTGTSERIRFWSLVLVYQMFLLPIAVWVTAAYASRIPRGNIVLAQLDSLDSSQRFRLVYLPYARGGFSVTFVISFLIGMQEYLYNFVLTHDEGSKTVTTALASLQAGDVYKWAQISAAGSATILCCLLLLVIGGRAVTMAVLVSLGEKEWN